MPPSYEKYQQSTSFLALQELILSRNSSNRIFNVIDVFKLLVIYMSQYESPFPLDGINWALILKLLLCYQKLNGPYSSNLSDMYSYKT